RHFRVTPSKVSDSTILQCGAVLTGRIKPQQCVAFGASCTPNTPLGALMVSSEGACAAYYQYQGIQKWSQ
ncbi:MAG: hydrogenase formation protein HypD, partial [Acetobacter sp.]|nr:hydrogenase formation protein HypD [Acetobacter sp.]